MAWNRCEVCGRRSFGVRCGTHKLRKAPRKPGKRRSPQANARRRLLRLCAGVPAGWL